MIAIGSRRRVRHLYAYRNTHGSDFSPRIFPERVSFEQRSYLLVWEGVD